MSINDHYAEDLDSIVVLDARDYQVVINYLSHRLETHLGTPGEKNDEVLRTLNRELLILLKRAASGRYAPIRDYSYKTTVGIITSVNKYLDGKGY